MKPELEVAGYAFRAATADDLPTIQRIIKEAQINPMGLAWERFLILELPASTLPDALPAATPAERIVGIGQIKPHDDGSRELASIAVIPAHQGKGLGAAIVQALIARYEGDNPTEPLYLMCRPPLQTFYQRFGFVRSETAELPRYFKRIVRIVGVVMFIPKLFGNTFDGPAIMQRAVGGRTQ